MASTPATSTTVEYEDLLGTPFEYGGRGDKLDCYGLVMVMAQRAGKQLPDFGVAHEKNLIQSMMGASLPLWQEIPSQTGAVVLIRVGRHIAHVAYQINDHQMIHAWEDAHGVSVVEIAEWQHRIVGFYKYVG